MKRITSILAVLILTILTLISTKIASANINSNSGIYEAGKTQIFENEHPRRKIWIRGHYVRRHRRLIWIPGHWKRVWR